MDYQEAVLPGKIGLSVSEEVAQDLELVGALALIADCLRTRYESSGFGGYNIYDDSRINISRDTHTSNLNVFVKNPDGDWNMVYSQRHRHLPQVRDGSRWRRYVMEVLYPKAEAIYRAEILSWQAEEAQKPRVSLAPFDDSEIFPDELFESVAHGVLSETVAANSTKKAVIVL